MTMRQASLFDRNNMNLLRVITNPRNSQGGFTLVELMVAGALSLILIIVVTQMILQTQTLAMDMMTRVLLNAEARQLFDLAAFGSYRNLDASGSSSPFNPRDHIAGIRGSNAWVDALGTDNSQLKTWHWQGAAGTSNATDNVNGSSAASQGHFLEIKFNKLRLRYLGLDGVSNVTPDPVQSSGLVSFACPNGGTATAHPNCVALETATIGYLFNRNNTVSYPSNLANNALVEYGVTHPATGAYKYFQGDVSRSLNFRMQLVDPEFIVENSLYTYPVDGAVTPVDGHSKFRSIPYQRKESYRTSFYMMVDY